MCKIDKNVSVNQHFMRPIHGTVPQYYQARSASMDSTMDYLTIKTPNSKCRLYWCFIEFIDWRHSQSALFFDRLCDYCLSNLLSG
jgi:hypothetical protein